MNFDALKRRFDDKEYFKRNFFSDEMVAKAGIKEVTESLQVDYSQVALKQISWFPDGLAYEMNLSKDVIKKNPGLKKFQRFFNFCTDSGLVTRQELVSMLPPLFLDVKETDMVLDMCAAPGSKTSQMIESQLADNHGRPIVRMRGGVVANDADNKRAYMLTHQLQRIDATGMLVTNHEGQFIPTMHKEATPDQTDTRFYFDKVLADVPCSGDGAIRKIPIKWRGWSSRDGCSLHCVQAAILERAIQVCKVGGLIVYSTCSLNPIENEAVVSDIVHRANSEKPGSLELIDIHEKYPGLKSRRGMLRWSVLVEKNEMKQFKTDDSRKYQAKDLFHILDSFDEETCKNYRHSIKGRQILHSLNVPP